MEIQAAILRDASAPFSIETVEIEMPRPDEILVRVVATGMCHTDIHARNPRMFRGPVICGHEGAGVVEAIGSAVRSIEVGDHVVMSFDYCGQCTYCRSGHPANCVSFGALNFGGMRPDGTSPVSDNLGNPLAARWFGQSSFANYAMATTRNCVRVDASLPLELLGPLGCGVQTGAGSVLLGLNVRPSSSFAVFGAGAVGLAAVMAAKVAGASVIIAVDLHESRLEQARKFGATHTFLGTSTSLLDDIRSVSGGLEYTMDTTGVPAVISTAIQALRPRGLCGIVGIVNGEITLPPIGGGKGVVGIVEGDAVPQVFIPQLIELWQSGRFPVDEMIEFLPLNAINDAESGSLAGRIIKPVLMM